MGDTTACNDDIDYWELNNRLSSLNNEFRLPNSTNTIVQHVFCEIKTYTELLSKNEITRQILLPSVASVFA